MDWSQLVTTAVTSLVTVGIGIYTFKSAIMKFLETDNEFLTKAVEDLQSKREQDRQQIMIQGSKIADLQHELNIAKRRITDLEEENHDLLTENGELKQKLQKNG